MATGYGVCVYIVYGLRAISSTGPRGQPGLNPYRDCAEIVQKSCNVSAVAVQSPQPPHGNRIEPVRGSAFARCPCGDCAMPSTTCLRAYDFFKFVKLLAKPNHRGFGARESVQKSHSRLLPLQGGRTERGIRAGYRLRIPIASHVWTIHYQWKLAGVMYMQVSGTNLCGYIINFRKKCNSHLLQMQLPTCMDTKVQ